MNPACLRVNFFLTNHDETALETVSHEKDYMYDIILLYEYE